MRLSVSKIAAVVCVVGADCTRASREIATINPPVAGHCPQEDDWSPPSPLESPDGKRWFIPMPTGAPLRSGLLLLGASAIEWVGSAGFDSGRVTQPAIPVGHPWAGALVIPGGRAQAVALPPNASPHWLAPLALPADDGAVDVIWGQQPDTGKFVSFLATSLWHARFDGVRWTAPEKIAEADAIWWDGATNSAIRLAGVLHVVSRAYDNTHGPQPWMGAIHVQRASGRWFASSIQPRDFFPRYTALLGAKPNELILIYSGSIRLGDSLEVNGLAMMNSVDGGASWSAPKLLRRLTGRSGYWLRADRTDAGEYRALWATLPDRDGGVSRLDQLISADGVTWRDTPGLVLPWQATGFAATHAENEHVVIQAIDGAMYATSWLRTGWKRPTQLPFEHEGVMAATIIEDPHRVLLAWNVIRRSPVPNDPHFSLQLMISRLRECSRQ